MVFAQEPGRACRVTQSLANRRPITQTQTVEGINNNSNNNDTTSQRVDRAKTHKKKKTKLVSFFWLTPTQTIFILIFTLRTETVKKYIYVGWAI